MITTAEDKTPERATSNVSVRTSCSNNRSAQNCIYSSSSITVEKALLGIGIPFAGAIAASAARENQPAALEDGQPKGAASTELQLQQIKPEILASSPTSTPPILLPSCIAIPIRFDNICVDVKVQLAKPHTERSVLNSILIRMGLGGEGQVVDKRVLFNVSGYIEPNRLVALMGSSGAGKSTLLNVLSRRISASQGQVTFSGTPITESIVQSCSAFVQQKDLFLNHLTVDEHLYSQIRLRLPELNTKQERLERETLLCNKFSLAKCRYNQIGIPSGLGGISGGERKRLNVASEISRMPAVLFADEPTTGLDSFMAESVITMLREMADSGRTVIATIHQPSSKLFEQFHEILLLAEGRLIYFGDRLGCIEWIRRLGFECPPYTNAADFIIKVIAMPEGSDLKEKKLAQIIEWAEKWKNEGDFFLKEWETQGRERFLSAAQSFANATIDASLARAVSQDADSDGLSFSKLETSRLKPDISGLNVINVETQPIHMLREVKLSWWTQVGILYQRAIRANRRNKYLIHARAIQTLFLALVFGSMNFRLGWNLNDSRSRIGGGYIFLLDQSVSGAYNVINTFTFEKPVIRREYESGLISSTAYITAKMLADAPVQIFFPIVFCFITFWLMGLNENFGRFMICLGIMLLTVNGAISIGYFASAVSPDVETAAVITNVVVVLLCDLGGGFLVKLCDVPNWFSWIQWFSSMRYGFENVLVTIFDKKTIGTPWGPVIGQSLVFDRTGFTGNNFALWCFMLVILLVFYRVVTVISFRYVLKRQKENA